MHHEGRVADSSNAEVSPRKRDVVADEVEKIRQLLRSWIFIGGEDMQ